MLGLGTAEITLKWVTSSPPLEEDGVSGGDASSIIPGAVLSGGAAGKPIAGEVTGGVSPDSTCGVEKASVTDLRMGPSV